ncbi:MAG: hypothetical protein DYH08_06835 [Actinobacteria bacterium ATB1]|nr:hypothetical protein [Actinobacteria bacterium ATB1]
MSPRNTKRSGFSSAAAASGSKWPYTGSLVSGSTSVFASPVYTSFRGSGEASDGRVRNRPIEDTSEPLCSRNLKKYSVPSERPVTGTLSV